jgi:glycosyltransferase involved in cell wall biosynthesis
MNRVSVVIPAFNEADRIHHVLQSLSGIDYIDDIIVVDDGSTDGTTQLVNEYRNRDPRIVLITNPSNLGKGQSVFSGVQTARNSIILMLDADLQHLTPGQVDQLCQPVMEGIKDMTIGVFTQGHWASDFSHWITPWLSGQRCLKSDLFKNLNPEAAGGYGLETALTIASHQYQWRVKRIALIGVSHPPSEIHRGSFIGFLNRMKMYFQIVRSWYIATTKKILKTELSEK